MDLNLMSCPTCGHSVNHTSGACAYCGALITEDQQSPTEDIEAAADPQSVEPTPPSIEPAPDPQSVESTPPSIEPDAPASADDSDPAVETLAPTQNQSKSIDSQEFAELAPDADAVIEETDSNAGVEEKLALADIEGQPASIESEPELKTSAEVEPLPVEAAMQSTDDLDAKSVADTDEQVVLCDPAAENDTNANSDEPAGPDSQEAQTDATVKETELTPEPNSADVAVDESGEAETLGENIIELAEISDIQEELEKTSIPEMSAPLDTLDEPCQTDSPEASPPESAANISINAAAGLTTESLGDTILLDITDEVQPEAEKVPPNGANSAQTPAAVDALKIEKAAQDLTAAVNKQRASMAETHQKTQHEAASTKVEAIKKQKAALAKTRAIKKQKMILAKAAALKRKKAAQAKAQALKKQEAARAGIENASKDEVTATITPGAVKHKSAKDPETSSELKKLLEKYKGQAVGINYDNSADIREAQLVEANSEYFSVLIKEKNLHYSYPLKTILTIIEGKDGVEAGESDKKSKFNAVIKVYPLVLF